MATLTDSRKFAASQISHRAHDRARCVANSGQNENAVRLQLVDKATKPLAAGRAVPYLFDISR